MQIHSSYSRKPRSAKENFRRAYISAASATRKRDKTSLHQPLSAYPRAAAGNVIARAARFRVLDSACARGCKGLSRASHVRIAQCRARRTMHPRRRSRRTRRSIGFDELVNFFSPRRVRQFFCAGAG